MTKPYKLPKNYLSWQKFQFHSKTISNFPSKKPVVDDFSGIGVGQYLSYLYQTHQQGFPVYCVRETLLNDMMATDVGENLALFSEINLPLSCYTLFFPKNKVKSPSARSGYIDYLIVCHEEVNLPEHKHLISWGGVDSTDDLIFSSKRIRTDGTLKRSHFSKSGKDQQEKVLALRNIVLQSILMLQFYPEVGEELAHPQETQKGFAKPQPISKEINYLSPRWLGKERSTSQPQSSIDGVGSKKSPHFRKGFWRVQPCGVGRQETKITWVRPTWVASEEI